MPEDTDVSRRDFLKGVATVGVGLALAPVASALSRVNRAYASAEKVTKTRSANSFIPQASDVHPSPEMGPGWNTEIYNLLRTHPYVGFIINGKPITGIHGESHNNPSVIEIETLERVIRAGRQVWSRDPLTVSAFTVPPATREPRYSGNGLFIHNHTLRQFGIYDGVYEGNSGHFYAGLEGYSRKDTHPVSLTRYPLNPNNSSDRLVFFEKKQQGNVMVPDFDKPPVEFRCVWADVISTAKEAEIVYGNEEPTTLFLTSCYPPEDWRSANPPGRTVMKLVRA